MQTRLREEERGERRRARSRGEGKGKGREGKGREGSEVKGRLRQAIPEGGTRPGRKSGRYAGERGDDFRICNFIISRELSGEAKKGGK